MAYHRYVQAGNAEGLKDLFKEGVTAPLEFPVLGGRGCCRHGLFFRFFALEDHLHLSPELSPLLLGAVEVIVEPEALENKDGKDDEAENEVSKAPRDPA